jgi:broad specificity phosphatase PhoE
MSSTIAPFSSSIPTGARDYSVSTDPVLNQQVKEATKNPPVFQVDPRLYGDAGSNGGGGGSSSSTGGGNYNPQTQQNTGYGTTAMPEFMNLLAPAPVQAPVKAPVAAPVAEPVAAPVVEPVSASPVVFGTTASSELQPLQQSTFSTLFSSSPSAPQLFSTASVRNPSSASGAAGAGSAAIASVTARMGSPEASARYPASSYGLQPTLVAGGIGDWKIPFTNQTLGGASAGLLNFTQKAFSGSGKPASKPKAVSPSSVQHGSGHAPSARSSGSSASKASTPVQSDNASARQNNISAPRRGGSGGSGGVQSDNAAPSYNNVPRPAPTNTVKVDGKTYVVQKNAAGRIISANGQTLAKPMTSQEFWAFQHGRSTPSARPYSEPAPLTIGGTRGTYQVNSQGIPSFTRQGDGRVYTFPHGTTPARVLKNYKIQSSADAARGNLGKLGEELKTSLIDNPLKAVTNGVSGIGTLMFGTPALTTSAPKATPTSTVLPASTMQSLGIFESPKSGAYLPQQTLEKSDGVDRRVRVQIPVDSAAYREAKKLQQQSLVGVEASSKKTGLFESQMASVTVPNTADGARSAIGLTTGKNPDQPQVLTAPANASPEFKAIYRDHNLNVAAQVGTNVAMGAAPLLGRVNPSGNRGASISGVPKSEPTGEVAKLSPAQRAAKAQLEARQGAMPTTNKIAEADRVGQSGGTLAQTPNTNPLGQRPVTQLGTTVTAATGKNMVSSRPPVQTKAPINTGDKTVSSNNITANADTKARQTAQMKEQQANQQLWKTPQLQQQQQAKSQAKAPPSPTKTNKQGEVVANPEYVFSEHDLIRPQGVPDNAEYVVNVHYRHGKTNANNGEPMNGIGNNPIPWHITAIDETGNVAPAGTSWFAGNKLGNWVSLLPASRDAAKLLRPVIAEYAPKINFVVHSPVQRAIDTMDLATKNIPLPSKESMSGLAERGVGGNFGLPKTPALTKMTKPPSYVPSVTIPNNFYPWTLTPDATPPESETMFLARMARTADEMTTRNYLKGNGLAFHHQYSFGGIQDYLYKMTGGAPELGMPIYGTWNPEPTRINSKTNQSEPNPKYNPELPVNLNGFKPAMSAGHDIPNGATLMRPGWAWLDEKGNPHFVPATKGYSDLVAPKTTIKTK